MRLEAGRSFLCDHGDGGIQSWPPAARDPFPEFNNPIPKIEGRDLSLDTLVGASYHHGALIIKNMLTPQRSAKLCDQIDLVMEEAAVFFKQTGNSSSNKAPSSECFNLISDVDEYAA